MNGARLARHRVATATLAVVATLTIAACGAPTRVATLDHEPDLVQISGTIPPGFSSSANEELRRLQSACTAIDADVRKQLPHVEHLELTDGQCQWTASGLELVVGILASPGGGGVLDQTVSVIKGERSVAGVGDRAVLDPQTRSLYVVRNGRLWYLQLVGSAPGVAAPAILAALGRALVSTPAATA